MYFHVYLFEAYPGKQTGRSYYFRNLDLERLQSRIVDAWQAGRAITYDGQTVDVHRSSIKIFSTEAPLSNDEWAAGSYEAMSRGEEATNDWITGPPGERTVATDTQPASDDLTEDLSPLRDRRRVMVVHGRNLRARDAIFMFLRVLGLRPIEWEQAVAETGVGSPHNLDAVRTAMDVGQAVVVVLTAEDQAGLLPALATPNDEDTVLRGQPRQNVILEAGLAMGVDRARTILVEIGPIRRASDFDGLNSVRLTNEPATRAALRSRLQSAGCELDESATDWMRPEASGDFDATVIEWEPTPLVGVATIFGLPSHELRTGRVRLSVRAHGMGEEARVVCAVSSPTGETRTATASAAPAGGAMILYSAAYPEDFGDVAVVAGTHMVTWSWSDEGGAGRELARDEFRFP